MIISIDLDAFYCGVEECDNPSLRDKPFCVVQKHVIATLNYPARALGIEKLGNIHTAKKQHPDLITVNGEDLTKYRVAGKKIYNWVRELTGGGPVERLGLEEMRLDLGPSIRANTKRFAEIETIKEWLTDPDFCDQVVGLGTELVCGEHRIECPNFYFNFEGETFPPQQQFLESAEVLEAYISGHVAQYIRDRMWLELGYSCSIGVASSKSYAKIACGLNKPRGVTVVTPGHEAAFMRTIPIAKIPGMGRATRNALGSVATVADLLEKYDEGSFIKTVSPVIGPKAAMNLWCTLAGEEPAETGLMIQDYTTPKQVSIEESYRKECPPALWNSEMDRLVDAVLIQTRLDCYDEGLREWLAIPKVLRLAVIFPNTGERRRSRSTPISWSRTPTVGVELQLGELHTIIKQKAQRLLRELVGKISPRVINVALVMDSDDRKPAALVDSGTEGGRFKLG